MHCHVRLTSAAFCLTMVLPLPLIAAQAVVLNKSSLGTLQQNFSFIFTKGARPLSAAMNTLELVKERTDKNQITHVRMQQHYAGVPVFGGYGILHSVQPARNLLGANNKITMNGVIYKGLEIELGNPSPTFMQNANVVLQQFKEQYQKFPTSEEEVMPMVYINDNHQAFWAYKVSLLVQYRDKIPARPTAIIDATTHTPFIQWNDIKTAAMANAKGVGFGGNERTRKFEFGKNLPYLAIKRDKAVGICYMENPGVKVVDMQHSYSSVNKPMQFACRQSDPSRPNTYWTGYQADGYDWENGAYSPTNDALYAGMVINRMYKKWFGVAPLTTAGKPMQLVMRVHYGSGYENAFWDGKQMTFGDGDTMMYPLVSLGVSAHEISHGFTEQHSNLVYFGQAGGMNEAFSDMAAQAAEYYSKRRNSWKIGAEIMKKDSGYRALRFMAKPSLDGASIDKADEYYSGLDVHYSSGVYNRLFYLLAHQPDWNTRKAFDVMVKANMDYWTPYSSFDEGSCGVISAAQDLGLPIEPVKKSLDMVAIDYQQCEDISFRSLAGQVLTKGETA
ncbi:zinc metalloprotease ProA [Legionella nagasakiensis]|nr:M4 family metallopeptidase [Legionella nagasakiensis]